MSLHLPHHRNRTREQQIEADYLEALERADDRRADDIDREFERRHEQRCELERWLAVHLFGWQEVREDEFPHRMLWREGEAGARIWDNPPEYTTDPAAALAVLEKCAARLPVGIFKRKEWLVEYESPEGYAFGVHVEAETLPLAICRFARKLFEPATP